MALTLSPEALDGLLAVSARLGAEDPGFEDVLERARAVAPAETVEEILLQAYLFVGFPVVLEAFMIWRGIARARPGEAAGVRPEEWQRRGEALCERVYGSAYDRLRQNVARLHPDLDRWMVMEGYGKVLGRPGLDSVVRELCIVATLAAAARPRQLHSHLRGALNLGATVPQVERAMAAGLAERTCRIAELRGVWEKVKERWCSSISSEFA